MSFFLLLIIILLVMLWPAIRTAFALDKARRQFADMQNRARQEARQEQQREQQRREARQSRPRPRKVYTRDEGEYVEFEEIESQETVIIHTETKQESQISDADWEEI